ncbi:DUF4394 domain-containing protein [Deinococcus depolymerans]|uniref:DUF4394 domain-containing protein n=1 Tax=Deinococcus depolymerans TaxID=392408 RepID=A0ABN1CBU6_9DEIO
MKNLALLTLISAALASCNQMRLPAPPAGQLAYGLGSDGTLVTFGLGNPDASSVTQGISGLGGDTLVDLDVRNTDGRLYGVAASGRVFMINPVTGAATADSTVTGATVVAADFNPVANRLRVAGTNDLNFRHTLMAAPTPATTGTTADGTFVYAPGDPNAGRNPGVVAAAYTNSFDNSGTGAIAAGTTTTLYTIDADLDILVMNTVGPQFNTLNTVGALGVNVMADMTGFDIAGAGSAYLSRVSGNDTDLYTVDLATGKATMTARLSGMKLRSVALKLAAQ